jgi:hypothetical protein
MLVVVAEHQPLLHHHEAQDVATQRVERLRGVAGRQTAATQHPERRVHRPERRETVEWLVALRQQLADARMQAEEPSPLARHRSRVVGPVVGGSGELELVHHAFGDALEDVVLVLDVVVQRHRLDAELPADPAHRDGLETLFVHDAQRRLDDPVSGERLAVPRFLGDLGLGSHVHPPSIPVRETFRSGKRRPVPGVDTLHRTPILRTL